MKGKWHDIKKKGNIFYKYMMFQEKFWNILSFYMFSCMFN